MLRTGHRYPFTVRCFSLSMIGTIVSSDRVAVSVHAHEVGHNAARRIETFARMSVGYGYRKKRLESLRLNMGYRHKRINERSISRDNSLPMRKMTPLGYTTSSSSLFRVFLIRTKPRRTFRGENTEFTECLRIN